ncbi:MAG: sel1 repeat family protein, partial [Gammaproteobacteria bacterium]|nr:sel1 repeat family protein [Gammaproteobacteria bacterium]NIM71748.1 sel1 repeat family protein [Gammaproteobacteria bacterium]NIN37844.1 sel1 repeat family protein [Gammaproteobacteria bacterium]NIO23504.1 sel1 repeat family protein [Gammaproteobacteria bacterium]NIO64120.1 sel1 repeat family protein [Gammaproteobacteria bacterium]
RWYERAARQGDANAMNNMAFMYGIGEGVEQSNVEAYAWFALAASRGNADAAQNRDVAAQ